MGINLISYSIYLIIFIFGLAVGSFLNCIIYRLQTDESFLIKRSYCPDCKKTLSWPDLIPLLSFLFLKGKCRYCQRPISLQYPLVELATGIFFIFITFQWLNGHLVNWLNFFYFLFVISVLIVIFVSDLRYYIIPDKVIYPAIGVTFIYRLLEIWNQSIKLLVLCSAEHPNLFECSGLGFGIFRPLINPFLSAALASAFFLAIILISRGRWMGWGDVKLAFFMGLLLGFPNILIALFLAFFFGAIMGIGLIIIGKKTLKSEIPFGPFLVAGTFIALFWGNSLISWYSDLFLA